MKKKERIEHSKFLIDRFDHYIEGANSKGNFLLAFSAFLTGFIITNYDEIVAFNNCNYQNWTNVILITLLFLSILSIGFTIAAVYPFLKTGNSKRKKYFSLVFFKSIANFKSKEEFVKKYQNQKNKKIDKDLSIQVYEISTGLKKKYQKISWAIRIVFAQLILMAIIILIKIV